MADESFRIGPALASASYLAIDRIMEVAAKSKATLVHPGYGFLAERADSRRRSRKRGSRSSAPRRTAIETMGDKAAARRVADAAGMPIVPGTREPVDLAQAKKEAARIGFPLLVKAAFGGGGKGMHVVRDADHLEESLKRAAREAKSYFGRPEVFLERYVDRAHHVEAQIMADAHGNVFFLGERDCSVQRRHQKLIEETPSPLFDDRDPRTVRRGGHGPRERSRLRERRHDRVRDGRGRRLLLPRDEHPAPGGAHGDRDGDRARPGRSPDPGGARREAGRSTRTPAGRRSSAGSTPRTRGGTSSRAPAGSRGIGSRPGRSCGWTRGSSRVGRSPGDYDSMFAKLVVFGSDREAARKRMLRALDEFVVEGVPTTIPVHRWILESKEFRAGTHTTTWLERALADADLPAHPDLVSAGPTPNRPADILVEVDGRRVPVRIFDERRDAGAESPGLSRRPPRRARARRDPRPDAGHDREGARREGPGGPARAT